MTRLEEMIYSMLTENTGTHMCDSGGENGRMWQRNQEKALNDFQNEPEATLELSSWRKGEIEPMLSISVFHYLTQNLELDNICNVFNDMPCENWDSSEFYGMSEDQERWLLDSFELDRDSWNTYNWDNGFSQDMQGREITLNDTRYVVLQIHGGADARGGYTNAKLFKVNENCEYFLYDSAFFEHVDFSGEWLTHEGSCIDDDFFNNLGKELNVSEDNPVILNGSI